MKNRRLLFIVCGLWFIFLCLLHYFSQRPLWLDENFVLSNIKNLSLKGVFGPLSNSQAFPRFYLAVIKFFSQNLNYHVLSLRLLPLVSMVCAFFVWARVYGKAFSSNRHYFLVLFSFSASYYLSYYASELKHYSMDVLVAGIFCLYLIKQKQYADSAANPSKPFVMATLILPVSLLFSYSGFFVFWAVAYNFLSINRKNAKFLPLLLGYIFICFLSIIFIFFFDLRHTLSTSALFSYWNDYFLCLDSFSCFFKTFGEGLRKLAVWWFGNSSFFRRAASIFIPVFVFSVFGYGVKSLKKNKLKFINIDTLALIVLLELFILGIMRKYPFTGERITLFFAPFVLYLIVKGISSVKKVKLLYLGLNIFYAVFLLACGVNSFLTYLKFYD